MKPSGQKQPSTQFSDMQSGWIPAAMSLHVGWQSEPQDLYSLPPSHCIGHLWLVLHRTGMPALMHSSPKAARELKNRKIKYLTLKLIEFFVWINNHYLHKHSQSPPRSQLHASYKHSMCDLLISVESRRLMQGLNGLVSEGVLISSHWEAAHSCRSAWPKHGSDSSMIGLDTTAHVGSSFHDSTSSLVVPAIPVIVLFINIYNQWKSC